MDIRMALRDEVPALLGLYRHLSPEDAPCDVSTALKNFDRIGAYPGSGILVATRGDAIVGSVTMILVPNLTRGGAPYVLVENVVTHADHRGQGIGKAMLAEVARRAWAAGCYKVMLMTGSQRDSTLGFYRAAGFEQSKTGFQIRRLPPREQG
ncbi:MAG: GNAT family N-acetyltransferase [Rhodobacteraceae bacterium]|nr:GNAT family N-acetyltransferase [Paracoccaceae bacterium]